MRQIIDEDPSQTVAQYADVSKVEKFQLGDVEYEKRQDTFRNFKKTVLKDHMTKVSSEIQGIVCSFDASTWIRSIHGR
jgi:hypothetical protein